MYFAGHNHHLSHLQKESSSTDYVISGSGGAHYRSVNERKKLKKSEAFDKYTFNDTGFAWLDITREKIHMRFNDSSGRSFTNILKKSSKITILIF